MSITIYLIIANVLFSYYTWQNPSAYHKYIFNPYHTIRENQWYRLITSGFMHADWGHLAFNMFTLYFFGDIVQYVCNAHLGSMGNLAYIGFYLVALIVSDLPTLQKHKDHVMYNSLGASGAVSAVVFFSIMFQPMQKLYLMFIPIGIPGFIFGFFYLLYSYYQGKRGADHINHDAHLYGALSGILFAIIIDPLVIGRFFQQVHLFAGNIF